MIADPLVDLIGSLFGKAIDSIFCSESVLHVIDVLGIYTVSEDILVAPDGIGAGELDLLRLVDLFHKIGRICLLCERSLAFREKIRKLP